MSDGSGEHGEKRRNIRNKRNESRYQRRRETRADDMFEERRERRPIAGDVDDEDRLLVQAELAPRQDLDRFVKRADAARQRRERVGPLGHDTFALMHVGDDDKLAETAMGGLAMFQVHRNDPRHPAAAGQHRIGDAAHQPIAATAINQLDPTRRKPGSELGRRRSIAWVGAIGGTAIDTKPPNFDDWMLHATPAICRCDCLSSLEQGAIASGLGAT
jgi:hypothetical protein